MDTLPWIDLSVLVGYLLLTLGAGAWFALRKRSSDEFMAGGRALPGWAVGLSMFGSYVSSISFLANPGKSFATNWNAFVFTLATPIAALVATRWFVPFYRRSGEVSAYEHLERRFGPWARTYAVVCFLLTQMARMGTVVYLLALAVSPLTGWDVTTIILLTGSLMVVCTIFGGMESVVWIGVVQSLVLVIGPVICIVALLWHVPGGLLGIVETASAADKFSLGSFSPRLDQPTFWVVLIYGLAINLGNFGIDQSYVQRYIATRDEREAKRSVWLTACLYVPVSALFFFIGTALYALYALRPELLPADLDPATQPDKIFPYFIAHQLPLGMSGLVVAAIFAASLDSSLSSMATLTLCDIYKRYLRPQAGERESLRVLRGATLGWGLLGTVAALAMIRTKNVLDLWWDMAGIFSGGMLGLFLLGLISRRARSPAAATAVVIGLLVIVWMSVSAAGKWPTSLGAIQSPFHSLMVTVVGTLTILLAGLLISARSEKTELYPSKPLLQFGLGGAWRVVRLVEAGAESPPREESGHHFLWFTSGAIVTGDKWAAWDMPFRIHSYGPPIQIDIRREDRAEPWLQPCIIEVTGDTLWICGAGSPAKPRPSKFSSTSEDGQILYVAERCDEPLPKGAAW